MSARLGAELSRERLSGRVPWIVALFGALAVLVIGRHEHAREPVYAVDRTLLGVAFGIVLPFVCYVLFESVHRRQASASLVGALARHGANARTLVAGLSVPLFAVAVGAGALVGALAELAARNLSEPQFARDLVACLWSGAVIGAAYAGLLSFGSLWGRAGRSALLVLDWLFGRGTGALSVPWPRSHARSLLGGEAVLELGQEAAVLCLLGMALSYPLVLLYRTRP